MSDREYVLRAEGIGKTFGKTQVLKSASLWAEPGKITTLMGRNGSGKTTLMRVAVGVMRPNHGMVSFLGDSSVRHSLPRLARLGLMYVPQTQALAPAYTVQDHFRALGSVFGSGKNTDAVTRARVGHLLGQRVDSLSGGERTRVSLGLALARNPKVLVWDEPLAGLSPDDQEKLGALLGEVAAGGTAVVTAGHDARILLNISDVIIWSVAGTTHALGSPGQALAHDQFCREYLGPDFQA